jgi:hypothetical protein
MVAKQDMQLAAELPPRVACLNRMVHIDARTAPLSA